MTTLVIEKSDAYGTHCRIDYRRHTGHFMAGATKVGFELVAPSDRARGLPCVVVEAAHFNGKPLGRDVYLRADQLCCRGFRHAWIPDVRHATAANLARLARALRTQLRQVQGPIQKVYGVGFSASAAVLEEVLAAPDQAGVFDASLVGTSPSTLVPPAAAGKVIRFNAEADFLSVFAAGGRALLDRAAAAQHLRWYVATGGPHLPDARFTRNVPVGPCGPPNGTTPLNWTPIARAAFWAADEWARLGTAPPANHLPVVDAASGEIARDGRGHARGGVRLPSLVLAEARFEARAATSCGDLFGSYSSPRSIGSPGFPATPQAYVAAFREAAQKLVDRRLMTPGDAAWLTRQAVRAAAVPCTYTQLYAEERDRADILEEAEA